MAANVADWGQGTPDLTSHYLVSFNLDDSVSALDLESQVGYELRPDTYSRFPTACEADGNHVSWMWRDVNNNTQGIATVTLP